MDITTIQRQTGGLSVYIPRNVALALGLKPGDRVHWRTLRRLAIFSLANPIARETRTTPGEPP